MTLDIQDVRGFGVGARITSERTTQTDRGQPHLTKKHHTEKHPLLKIETSHINYSQGK